MVEEREVKTALDRMEALLAKLGDNTLNDAFAIARVGQYGQFQWKGLVYDQES